MKVSTLLVGLLVGIYLAEYAEGSHLGGLVRSLCDALTSIPTIILGVIGYAILVVYLRDFTGGLSLLSGSLTLSVLVTPFIARGTEEAHTCHPPEPDRPDPLLPRVPSVVNLHPCSLQFPSFRGPPPSSRLQ